MPDLLIELFSEEIPARMQARAADDLKRLVTDGLVEAGLTYASAAAFSTPRRLALTVEGLLPESPATREERKGPRVDAPEKALEGFLRSTGLSKDQLEARDDKKGQVWFAVIAREGRPASGIVAEVLESAVRNFPWPKSMRWASGNLRWVRPLHSIVCLLSDEEGASIVDVEIDGIRAGDTTEGHRFMAPGSIKVTSFDDYRAKLQAAHVVLSAEDRGAAIWHDAEQLAFAQGLEVVEDKGLLAEVSGLVEWPVVLMGAIDEEFLELPAEVLQTSMKEHQKFFSVKGKTGRITHFITVANRETADNGATILAGNQKVLSARLADAKFFWENDLRIARTDITQWTDALADVTFHNKLGSQLDRIHRIRDLAKEIAPLVGAPTDDVWTAALVAKADLSSEMVYEFPELQGVMGEYYALEAALSDEIAAAAREHYQPLGPSDNVPTSPVSVAVALADKIDTLTGFWSIDEKPTGSKDPFALRRAALGVIRLVLENGVRCTIASLASPQIKRVLDAILEAANNARKEAAEKFKDETGGVAMMGMDIVDYGEVDYFGARVEPRSLDLLSFIHDRLKVFLRDRGIRHDVIDACLAMPNADDLTLLVKRAEALSGFLKTEEGENLLQGFKRAHNILKQAEEKDGVEYSFGPDPKLAETEVETALFSALDSAEAEIAPAMEAEDFGAAMSAMAGLRGPVDAFFEAVQVNADSEILRRNRLNLLHRISATCLSVADLTKVEG